MKRRLEALTITAFVVGAAVMLIFDGLIARLVGVAGLATFIVSGLFLIADPDYLQADEPD
jgi:hypothetical protein